jgi:hypothetical protein
VKESDQFINDFVKFCVNGKRNALKSLIQKRLDIKNSRLCADINNNTNDAKISEQSASFIKVPISLDFFVESTILALLALNGLLESTKFYSLIRVSIF